MYTTIRNITIPVTQGLLVIHVLHDNYLYFCHTTKMPTQEEFRDWFLDHVFSLHTSHRVRLFEECCKDYANIIANGPIEKGTYSFQNGNVTVSRVDLTIF